MPVKYRMALTRSPASDPQQYRLYRMESEAIGARGYVRLTQSTLARFVRSLCREYRMPVPTLRFGDIGKWGAEWHPDSVITINTQRNKNRDLLTLTHELGHHLHDHLAPDAEHEPHGPQFMACYMSLLDTARIIPVVGMRAICDHYKVRYADPGDRNSLTTLRRAVTAPA